MMKHTGLLLALAVGLLLAAGCGGSETGTATPTPAPTEPGGQAEVGKTVRVHYTGTLEDGAGKMIPGFEQAVLGMRVGDVKTVTIPPEQAYGPYRDELVQAVPRDQLPPGIEPAVGMVLQQVEPNGVLLITIIEVTESTVTLDANHSLAGQTLTFEIELVEVL
jgi:peptidylprolyl isomerase